MRIVEIDKENISKYYDTIIMDIENNPVLYYKPKIGPSKINYIILNGAMIEADNPHVIIDGSTIKIIPYELDQENIIKIDDLYSDIYKVLIRVKNVYRSDKIAVSVVIDIDKNRHDCEIYIIDV